MRYPDFKHFKGIEINGDYNIVITESEDNDLDKIKLMLGGDDMMEVYEPERLRLVMVCNARGGISSKLTVDSDWKARGGEEQYKDWVGQMEEW